MHFGQNLIEYTLPNLRAGDTGKLVMQTQMRMAGSHFGQIIRYRSQIISIGGAIGIALGENVEPGDDEVTELTGDGQEILFPGRIDLQLIVNRIPGGDEPVGPRCCNLLTLYGNRISRGVLHDHVQCFDTLA